MKSLNYFETYIMDDTKWKHSIMESLDEFMMEGEDLDHNGCIDCFDYELYLDSKVKNLDHFSVVME
jgi:hypothetical protein